MVQNENRGFRSPEPRVVVKDLPEIPHLGYLRK